MDADAYINMILPELVGFKITGGAKDASGEFWGFTCQKGKEKKIVWVNCDPEGNGAGFLEVQKG